MKLYLEATSERGKAITKSSNDYINMDLTVHRQSVGQIELYLNHDTEDGECTEDEWLIKYYRNPENEDEDPIIIAQGNIAPEGKCRTCGEIKGKHSDDACEPSRQEYPIEPHCIKCRSTMTELVDEWVCDNESCGYNLIKKE